MGEFTNPHILLPHSFSLLKSGFPDTNYSSTQFLASIFFFLCLPKLLFGGINFFCCSEVHLVIVAILRKNDVVLGGGCLCGQSIFLTLEKVYPEANNNDDDGSDVRQLKFNFHSSDLGLFSGGD